MDSCTTTFSLEEIQELFKSEGIDIESDEFRKELTRRFRPSEGAIGVYVESELWLTENNKEE